MQGEVIRHTRLVRYCVKSKIFSLFPCINMYKTSRDAKNIYQSLIECDYIEEATLYISVIDIIKKRTPNNNVVEEIKFKNETIAMFMQY